MCKEKRAGLHQADTCNTRGDPTKIHRTRETKMKVNRGKNKYVPHDHDRDKRSQRKSRIQEMTWAKIYTRRA